jgi:hypothetical protein
MEKKKGEISTFNTWIPGDRLQVAASLDAGISRRMMSLCREEERSPTGVIRLAVRKLLEAQGY